MTELEKAAFEQEFDKLWFGNLEVYFNHDAVDYANIRSIALHFVNWQKEQFEKERLKHCDELTAEQAQIESDFVVQHLEKYNRTPTFIDAIEYGAKWRQQQFRKIENYQEEGWYSSGDDEYVYGISFDEPVKLPVEFYYKKKED